jgi:hypothetical protein
VKNKLLRRERLNIMLNAKAAGLLGEENIAVFASYRAAIQSVPACGSTPPGEPL